MPVKPATGSALKTSFWLQFTSEDSSSSLPAAFRFRGCLALPAGRPRCLPPSPAAALFRGAAAPLALARDGVLIGELPLRVVTIR